jgi:hypothetical protein
MHSATAGITSLADVAGVPSTALVSWTAVVSEPLGKPDAAEQAALVSCTAAASGVLRASVTSAVSMTAASANKRASSATHGAAAAAAAPARALLVAQLLPLPILLLLWMLELATT